jgi:hypothetical protein
MISLTKGEYFSAVRHMASTYTANNPIKVQSHINYKYLKLAWPIFQIKDQFTPINERLMCNVVFGKRFSI